MSLQTDIITALSAVASGQVYPQFVPADIEPPFVVYRIASKDPLQTIDGTIHMHNSSVVFECYADTYAQALTLAASVRSAITSASFTEYEDSAPGESYEPQVDLFMEPVYYGFWHT